MSTCEGDSAGESGLDFLSGEFDPLRALQAPPDRVALPCPSVQPCDNLDMYDSLMKGTRKVYSAPEKEAEPIKPEVGVADTTPKRRIPNTVLRFMQEARPGPFSLLQRCLGDGASVRVWTRHCAGVRGVCEGVLLAFDKHFNLVLGNVREEYTPFKTVANGGARGKRKRVRKRTKPPAVIAKPTLLSLIEASLNEEEEEEEATSGHVTADRGHVTPEESHVTEERISRKFKQLFIRGDSVVMLSPKAS